MGTNSDDLDLIRTRVTALINLGKFEEALENTLKKPGFEFEKAYVLYKLGQFQESLAISTQRPEKSFKVLRAQTVSIS